MKSGFYDILLAPLRRDTSLRLRSQAMEWVGKKVPVVIGPRRSGKSSLLSYEINQLVDKGVPENHIVSINLEDDRLDWVHTSLDDMLQTRMELFPNVQLSETWFFLDEVQNAPNWEKFVRRLHDTPGTKVAITGSNSKMLATEVATAMRGRGYPVEILPLSFEEYLQFEGVEKGLSVQHRAKIAGFFKQYLEHGGFPETIGLLPHQRRKLLQNYYNTMIFRDVVERYNTSQFFPLKYMLSRVAYNLGKTLSLRKIAADLRSQGYKLANETLYDLADMAEAGYFFKRISKFDFSLVKREMSDKKAYFIDNGLVNAITTLSAGNFGALFENLVFWELYRKHGNLYTTDIYYYKDQTFECDFILYSEGGVPLPVQACYDTENSDTKAREIKGLLKACDVCGVKNGWLITMDEEGVQKQGEVTINIMMAWKWSLGYYKDLGPFM